MTVLLIIIGSCYTVLIGLLYRGIDKVQKTTITHLDPSTSFSVLIPFRDEAEHLPALLTSLTKLAYNSSLFEIIFIDDASADESRSIVTQFIRTSALDATLIDNHRRTSSPKKDALSLAIEQAKHPWIVTTDADVLLPIHWLSLFDQPIQNTPSKLLVGPVVYLPKDGWLAEFQAVDQLSLQASTLGGFGMQRPFLCSGANLCYEKKSFVEIDPFKDNSHIASGDDIFLLHSFKKQFPEQVHYINASTAMVYTYPEATWKDLIQQRLRWAAKTSQVKDHFTSLVGILVIAANIGWILSLVLLFTSFWGLGLIFLGLKFSLDYLLLLNISKVWNQRFSRFIYLRSALIYPIFILFIGMVSMFSSYRWKGNLYKK